MHRDDALARLGAEVFDIAVIGGGITGCGVALDAALRGLKVALVERDDYASGTSSKSSKLIHGGLRYLAHLEVGLVREALTERAVLQRMAPHLCRPVPFLIPRYGRRRLLPLRAGLQAYDVLALGSGFPRHRTVDRDDALRMAPGLKADPDGGLVYWDARTDDARLTWTIARTAIEHGAVLANHVRVDGFVARGLHVSDVETGTSIELRARSIVNATGVWTDTVRALEDPGDQVGIRPSKGIHVVFDADRIPVNTALLVPAPDGRYVFVIPWEPGRVVVGTTDEDYTGPLDEPRAEKPEIDYLLDVINRVLERPAAHEDVVATFAGLRPLVQKPGESTKDLSRRHKVLHGPLGVVTVTGGKLTTWRPMAADAVDAAVEAGELGSVPKTRTESAKLAGGDRHPPADSLAERYGSLSSEVWALVEKDPSLGEPLVPDRPTLKAEAVYAIEREEARSAADVIERRLRLRITSADRGLDALDWVVARLAGRLGWDAARAERESAAYRAAVAADMAAERGA